MAATKSRTPASRVEATANGPKPASSPAHSPVLARLAPLIIAAAALLAYANCFRVPFLYDDVASIPDNPTIRQLWRLDQVLSPPSGGITVAGRPLLNFTLAVNYALGGLDLRGYHALNLLIHILAGCALFGFIRRTFARPPLAARFGPDAAPLALGIALLWLLHPLQTESVTYIIQRAESLMGLLYLLTLYCFARALDSTSPRLWLALSCASCWLGMAAKEVMVSAPLIVLVYDAFFGAGSFREAWRRRRVFYVSIFTSWLLLAALVIATGGRGETVNMSRNSPLAYALIQCWAAARYLRLAFWPSDLVFDYGLDFHISMPVVFVGGLVLLSLAGLTVRALSRRHPAGFAGLVFFAVLAPTTSFIPIASEVAAEHRMYLPLAVVVVLVAAALHLWLGRRSFWLLAACALALGGATFARNRDYRDALSLWKDTTDKLPRNARAMSNLADAYLAAGRFNEALAAADSAVKISPNLGDFQINYGKALAMAGRNEEALAQFQAGLKLAPDSVSGLNNIGLLLNGMNKPAEALPYLDRAAALKPNVPDVAYVRAVTMLGLGNARGADAEFRRAITLRPSFPEAEHGQGQALAMLGRNDEAIRHFAAALKMMPQLYPSEVAWGQVLAGMGRFDDARSHFNAALRIAPGNPDALRALAALPK